MESSTTHDYRRRLLRYSRDGHDCAIRAIAAATGEHYIQVLAFARREGLYSPQDGATIADTVRIINRLGYRIANINAEYVGPPTLRTLSRALREERTPGGLIAITCNHAAGFYNGECFDYAERSLKKVKLLWRIERA